ncbi:hypothetical protein [Sphingobium indicum]|uniref:hypothetical protein n=1 Tax=Sphingobium indicum TaxID=332055 RepID=UPI0012FF294F|nr:hypothetical protein [Sphingobium indicum]
MTGLTGFIGRHLVVLPICRLFGAFGVEVPLQRISADSDRNEAERTQTPYQRGCASAKERSAGAPKPAHVLGRSFARNRTQNLSNHDRPFPVSGAEIYAADPLTNTSRFHKYAAVGRYRTLLHHGVKVRAQTLRRSSVSWTSIVRAARNVRS